MHRLAILGIFLNLFSWLALSNTAAARTAATEIIEVRKIWDQPGHQSFFTDLIRFRGQWICTFREAATHNSDDGRVRLIASSDGKTWSSLAQIECPPPNRDLRDPKLSITPQGKLMLTATAYRPQPECRSYVWFSDDGKKWSEPHRIGPPGEWLWRTEWHKGIAYNFGRSEKSHFYLQLYRSSDGKDFQAHGPRQFDGDRASETAVLFRQDEMCVTLLRRGDTARIGVSRPPYIDWDWKDLGVRVGGPEMIQLPDGRYLATVRLYVPDEHTSLCWIDPEAGTLDEFLRLPSGGDTSYAGTVWHDGLVWISYYSSHEGKTSIYLAKVRID
ncbi:sialidase family protein [Pirellulales bacterium]|nr:sialidase family protein [Pirellulales bacterium]